jgi:hypothetical protein
MPTEGHCPKVVAKTKRLRDAVQFADQKPRLSTRHTPARLHAGLLEAGEIDHDSAIAHRMAELAVSAASHRS